LATTLAELSSAPTARKPSLRVEWVLMMEELLLNQDQEQNPLEGMGILVDQEMVEQERVEQERVEQEMVRLLLVLRKTSNAGKIGVWLTQRNYPVR
jgi:hypothetical protein